MHYLEAVILQGDEHYAAGRLGLEPGITVIFRIEIILSSLNFKKIRNKKI